MTPADLKRFSLLSELSEEDRDDLFEQLEPLSVRKGRSIFRETAEADGLVLIVSGSVRLESSRRDDLGTLGAGSILGTAALLSMGRREVTAKTEEPCELLLLARTSYRRLVEDHPRAACRLTEAIAADLAGLLRQGLDSLAPSTT